MMDENAAEAYRDSVSNDIHDGKFDEDVVARFQKMRARAVDFDKFISECTKILIVSGRLTNEDMRLACKRSVS